jgi:transposase-like protein
VATLFIGNHLNVRWYCRYALSYRDLEEMMERGIEVDHSTINRWVLKYATELDKRIRPHLRSTNDSWRVDETYRYRWRIRPCL